MRSGIATNCKLHHDNASRHTCFVIKDNLRSTSQASLPSRSVPGGLFLVIPQMKTALKGHHYGIAADVKEDSTCYLKYFPEKYFQCALKGWITRWQKCVDTHGPCFVEFQLFIAISTIHVFYRIWSPFFYTNPVLYKEMDQPY